MNYLFTKRLASVIVFISLLTGCNTDDSVYESIETNTLSINEQTINAQIIHYENQGIHEHQLLAKTESFIETFESGTKGSYAEAIVNLTGYDLLENIPDSIESVIESNIDGGLNL